MKLVSKKRKYNKGFSLVELIVVVLIIAIIAVALAPQVMKWVGTARENTDKSNIESIKSSIQIALADFESQGGTLKELGDVTITIGTKETKTKVEVTTGEGVIEGSDVNARTKLLNIIDEILAGSYPTPHDSSNNFVVRIKVKENSSKTIILEEINVNII